MEKNLEKVFNIIQMEKYMMEIGLIIHGTGMEFLLIKMEVNILVNSKMGI
jgi:hypothetical protein